MGKLLSWNWFCAVTKKSVFAARMSYWSAKFLEYSPGYYLTFVSLALFDLSNGIFSKKLIFTSCSVLIDFCHYLHLPLNLFLFEFFWKKELFEEVATVAAVLMDVLYMLELNPSGFVILIALTLLMRIVWSFVWSFQV